MINTIKINGRVLTLSPRKAKDVLALAEASQGVEQTTSYNMITAAQIVNDSFKATYLNILQEVKNINIFKKFGCIKESKDYSIFMKNGVSFILEKLTSEELSHACTLVLELEGIKKKEITTAEENQ